MTPANRVRSGSPWPAPPDTKLNDVFWKFTARNGHGEVPQENHLTAEWRGQVKAGQKLSFLTVFVPLPEGTTAPPPDLKLAVEAGRASVKFGNFNYVFPGGTSESHSVQAFVINTLFPSNN